MPRRSKTDQDVHWMRSFWDEVRTMNVDHKVEVQMYVHPSKRPGVFVFRLLATSVTADPDRDIGTQALQFEYPSASLQSLPSTLFAYSVKLSRMVIEAWRDLEARPRKRG